MDKDVILQIRLPKDLKAEIEAAARTDDRPVAALVRRILSEWLAEQPKKRRGR